MNDLVKQISFKQHNRHFVCDIYPLNHLPETLHGHLQEFYCIWKKACNGKNMPKSTDMGFEYLKGWHSQIRVAEYGNDINAPKKIKIMGEIFERHWGKEAMYDKLKPDNSSDDDIRDKYYNYLSFIYKGHYCIGSAELFPQNGLKSKVKWIDLPLSDNGKNVSHAIAAMTICG